MTTLCNYSRFNVFEFMYPLNCVRVSQNPRKLMHTNIDKNRSTFSFVKIACDEKTKIWLFSRATIVHTKSTDYKTTTSLPPAIVPDPECGSTKGCQSDCDTGTCSYQVTWKRSGDLVRFEFQQELGTGNKYQAIGLSNDSLMVNLIFKDIIF